MRITINLGKIASQKRLSLSDEKVIKGIYNESPDAQDEATEELVKRYQELKAKYERLLNAIAEG
jgi:hypothetical protein